MRTREHMRHAERGPVKSFRFLAWPAAAAAVLLAALVLAVPNTGANASTTPQAVADTVGIPGFRDTSVPIDGGSLHAVIGGSGPPLVLLHGWPQTWWAWHLVMPSLAADHTVIAFDLPGLGSSTIPASGYDTVTMAGRIRQAVHALGYNQVQILAHDMGALIAYPYARDYPNEVSRLAVLETPLPGFGLENAYGLSWHFLFNMSPAPIPENIIDNKDVPTYLGMLFNGAHHPEAIDVNRYYTAYSDPTRRSAGYNYYRAFPTDSANDVANASKQLTMPVLAMGAQYVFGAGVAASFQQVAKDVRGVVVPDSGHFIPEENPTFLIACAELFFGATAVTPPSADLANCAK